MGTRRRTTIVAPFVLRRVEINSEDYTNKAFEPRLSELTGWTDIAKVTKLAINNGSFLKFLVHILLNSSHRQRNHADFSLEDLRVLLGSQSVAIIGDYSFQVMTPELERNLRRTDHLDDEI